MMTRTSDGRSWWVYVLLCHDGRTYTGMALDVERRFRQHLGGTGAVFTRINPPVCIVGARRFPCRADAQAEERALKRAGRYWIKRWCRHNPWMDPPVPTTSSCAH